MTSEINESKVSIKIVYIDDILTIVLTRGYRNI